MKKLMNLLTLVMLSLSLLACGQNFESMMPSTVGSADAGTQISLETYEMFSNKLDNEIRSETVRTINDLTDDEIVERHLTILSRILEHLESGEAQGIPEEFVGRLIEKLTQRISDLENDQAARDELVARVRAAYAEFQERLESGEIQPPAPDCDRMKENLERDDLQQGLKDKIQERYDAHCS